MIKKNDVYSQEVLIPFKCNNNILSEINDMKWKNNLYQRANLKLSPSSQVFFTIKALNIHDIND